MNRIGAFLLPLLLLANVAWATPTIVQQSAYGNGTCNSSTAVTTGSINVTSGHLLVETCSTISTLAACTSPSADSQSLTWTAIFGTGCGGAAGVLTGFWAVANATGAETVSNKGSGTGSTCSNTLFEISGANTTTPIASTSACTSTTTVNGSTSAATGNFSGAPSASSLLLGDIGGGNATGIGSVGGPSNSYSANTNRTITNGVQLPANISGTTSTNGYTVAFTDTGTAVYGGQVAEIAAGATATPTATATATATSTATATATATSTATATATATATSTATATPTATSTGATATATATPAGGATPGATLMPAAVSGAGMGFIGNAGVLGYSATGFVQPGLIN